MCLQPIHIPAGKHNLLADTASRKFYDASEWMLSKNIFNHLACFGMSEIDLFISRLNKQLHRYASWMPDPDASYIARCNAYKLGKSICIFILSI